MHQIGILSSRNAGSIVHIIVVIKAVRKACKKDKESCITGGCISDFTSMIEFCSADVES